MKSTKISRSSTLDPLTNLPFSEFQDVPEIRDAGLTPGDLHAASNGGYGGGLKSWPMIHRGRVVPHTSMFYVREWIAARREGEVSEWARSMAAAPQHVQDIERLIT